MHGARLSQAALQTNILEGLWWKQESGVTGFISLSNTSSNPVNARIRTSDATAQSIAEHPVMVSPHGTKLRNLYELGTAPSSWGGIQVTWDGAGDGLIVNGGLKDEAVGYSARLPLHFPPVASAQTAKLSYAAVGLMTGAADPMMSFPSGTTFTPYAVVRNISDQPLSLTPTLWWTEGSIPRSARLNQFTLPAYSTKNLDFSALASTAGLSNFSGSVNLVIDTAGKSRALLMATGSVDQRNTYVFEVFPTAVVESVAKTLSYWSTDNGDDTMVTLWNPSDEAQELTFTLFFTGGHYRLPIHLDPRATRMFNISEIIHTQIPDDERNTIPSTVHDGNAEIAGSQGENEHILVAMDAGTYNVRKATCGTFCVTCHGANDAWIIDDPFVVAVGTTHQLTFTVQYDSGTQYNHTTQAAWSSSNTGIATVNTGLVNAVSAGSASMDALDANVPDYFHGCWGSNPDSYCPQSQGEQADSPGTVQPTVTISGSTYLAMLHTGSTGGGNTATLTATGNPSGGTYAWTAVSGQSSISISNPNSATTNIQAVAVGTYTLKVSYTVNNQTGTATAVGRVQQPGSLGVVSNETIPFNCASVGDNYITQERDIQYQVLDTSSPPVPVQATGMELDESLHVTTNTCGATLTPTTGAHSGNNGLFPLPDHLRGCSSKCLPADANGNPKGSCQLVAGQIWSVNGYQVKSDTLTFTCPGPPTGAP
jgi:Bacterial Ig-like domain (group 2)